MVICSSISRCTFLVYVSIREGKSLKPIIVILDPLKFNMNIVEMQRCFACNIGSHIQRDLSIRHSM